MTDDSIDSDFSTAHPDSTGRASNDKLRRRIAFEAARLLSEGQESHTKRATIRAARLICRDWVKDHELPSEQEIREQLQLFARINSLPSAADPIARSSSQSQTTDAGFPDLGQSVVDPSRFTPIDPELDAESHTDRIDDETRYRIFQTLLKPLAGVQQHREQHPEGDALYHSLQVFELARNELPYDEEFLLAALLHDVGKAIDPLDHTAAGLAALEGLITERTAWLIEHHLDGRALADGKLGARARHRLEASPDFEELKLLADCDRRGRVPGMQVCEIEEALAAIRELAEMCGDFD